MTALFANTRDDDGNEICLRGRTLRGLAKQLAKYKNPSIRAVVVDDHEFVRGWIKGTGDWVTA
jgi:hypothetical protein